MIALLSAAALTGFATAFALILAIGAQNAFVLRQGLGQMHVFWVCLVCAVSDATLIAAGVAGFAAAIARLPWLPDALALGGAAFLFGYGALRLRAAYRGGSALGLDSDTKPQSLRSALLTCLAFTWLNPHVYLDTLGLIGAVSAKYAGTAKLAFAAGAMTSSFIFFFGLGYGARYLAPLMRKPRAWVFLDAGIGVLMWGIAFSLILPLL